MENTYNNADNIRYYQPTLFDAYQEDFAIASNREDEECPNWATDIPEELIDENYKYNSEMEFVDQAIEINNGAEKDNADFSFFGTLGITADEIIAAVNNQPIRAEIMFRLNSQISLN